MNTKPLWIKPETDLGDVAPLFFRDFAAKDDVESAFLTITGMGVYVARINGARVGDYIMAPGWTS